MSAEYTQKMFQNLNKKCPEGASLVQGCEVVNSLKENELRSVFTSRMQYAEQSSLISASSLKTYGQIPASVAFGKPDEYTSIIFS